MYVPLYTLHNDGGKQDQDLLVFLMEQDMAQLFHLLSVYMGDLIVEIRNAGVGCHIVGVFCGVVGYADDLCSASLLPEGVPWKLCSEYVKRLTRRTTWRS